MLGHNWICIYIYIWSPPVSAPDLPCRAGGNDLLLHLQSFSARGQTHGNTVHICIYIYIYCNWDMFLYTYKYIYIIYICKSMWIMIVSFLSLDVQLMHDEDQDVIEGSRGDIARIWYWQVVRVKIIDRKFGLFFSGPPPKKNASEDSYPNFEPWPCVCVWKCRRPNCQWQLWGNICWYIISFRIGGTLS